MNAVPLDPAAVASLLRPFGSSRSLPAAAYTSPEVWHWEMRALFGAGWVAIGRSADHRSEAHAVDVAGETVLVTRDAGVARVLSNTCRHRGHQLLEPGAARAATQIRCPYHSWTYRLDGTLKSAPALTRSDGFDPSDWPLERIRADEWLGWLFVNLDGDAKPLDSYLGGLSLHLADHRPDTLVGVAHKRYEVKANWKLIVENYHECYHCSTIHPELCEITPPDSGTDLTPDGVWCGGTMTLKPHAETMSADGRSAAGPLPGLPTSRHRTVLYVGLFPNLLVSAHPDYVLTHRLTPTAPDRTIVECEWLFDAGASMLDTFDPGATIEFWDQVNRQDWRACEQVQLGARNRGFRPGPLSGWEATIYQLHSILGRAYQGLGLLPPVAPPQRFPTP